MTINRRLFTAGLATSVLARPSFADVSDDRVLFWSVEQPDKPRAILFGYERIAGARTQDIVRDGERFAGEQDRLIGAVPNAKISGAGMDRSESTPLLDRLSKPTAERVRTLIGHDSRFQLDRLSGIEFLVVMIAAGQAPTTPSVGGTIAEHAQAQGKPLTYLLSQDDLEGAVEKHELAAVDKRIDDRTVTFLLDLRDRVGPIGKHYETLYAERRSGDIEKLNEAMRQHAVPGVGEMAGISGKKVEAMMVERTIATLKKPEGKLFMLLPLGTMREADGILAKLRQQDGMKIAPLA